ncbi:type VII secretion AAA-ATPase EccA [Prescottella sp. R16]|uniref:type VII secretion AAA-ATPase EccA n=1 Tax=Prescottella sp. R16 TaxID=3064529 RepID=UPI00272E710F|nr:type VII secretion AAA-ATPase EccA [Prescottella sp. R16]
MFESTRARKSFDGGVRALGLPVLGRRSALHYPTARARFVEAVEFDPDMCDAWLGLAATGVVDRTVVDNLLRTARGSLGREQLRLGLPARSLAGRFATGMFVDHPLSDGLEIWAAAAAQRIEARQFSDALAILDSVDAATPLAAYMRGILFARTERWPDVLQALSRSETWTDEHLRTGAHYMTGRACAHLGLFDEAHRRLTAVDAGPIPNATHYARHLRGLVARAQGNETTARQLFERVYVAQPGFTDNARALDSLDFTLSRTTADRIARRRDPWDPQSAPDETVVRQEQQQRAGAAAVDESRRALDAMIGLTSVKREVEKLTAASLLARSTDAAGPGPAPKSRHLVFTGPPGVGKTEVARILARMYYGLGVLATDTVVEASPSDFFAPGYGTPEARSREIFESALDGVLFIDEAYSLYHDGIIGGDAAGGKVVDALLATMENHRDRLVVIVAGYETEMDGFLERNAGLKSRFTKTIRFPSYTPDELARIAARMASSTYRATLADPAVDEVLRVVTHLCTTTEQTSDGRTRTLIDREGNARFVRNLLETSIEERDLRLVSSTPDLQALTAADRGRIERSDVGLAVAERFPHLADARTP